MSIKSHQVRMYMNARNQGASQASAASMANISERSAQRIESGTHQQERGTPRNWRTRTDPLAQVWASELEPMLHNEPRLNQQKGCGFPIARIVVFFSLVTGAVMAASIAAKKISETEMSRSLYATLDIR